MFLRNYRDSEKNTTLYIYATTSAPTNVTVNVTVPVPPFTGDVETMTGNVTNNHVLTFSFPEHLQLDGNEIAHKVLRVTSDYDIVLFAASTRFKSGDAFLVYSTDYMGHEYVLVTSEEPSGNVNSILLSAAAIGAVHDITSVRINLKHGGIIVLEDGRSFTDVVSVVLMKHQALQIGKYDLAGSIVTSNKPVAINSGHYFLRNIALGSETGDHVQDRILPVEYWSDMYVVVSAYGDPNLREYARVFCAESNTTVTVMQDGDIFREGLEKAGDFKEYFVNGSIPLVIYADKRIAVAQINIPHAVDKYNDPHMHMTTPVSFFKDSYTFLTPGTYTGNTKELTNILVLVADNLAAENAVLDNQQINPNVWIPISNTSFFYTKVNLESGALPHTLQPLNAGGLLGGYIQGYELRFSYSTSIGASICAFGNCKVNVIIVYKSLGFV